MRRVIGLLAGALALALLSGCERGPAAAVPAASATSAAAASPSCDGGCAVGEARCAGSGATQACVLRDGCGVWGEAQACADGCEASGGRCRAASTEPASGLPGSACDSDRECPGRACVRRAGGREWPGGACAADCTRFDRCEGGTACVDFPGDRSVCVPRCSTPGKGQGACRTGYVCEDDGAGRGLCLPRCTAHACALLGRACDETTGHCADCGRPGERCCPVPGGATRCDEGRCGTQGTCG